MCERNEESLVGDGSMFGSEVVFNPSGLLAMWAAGILGSGAFVIYRRIAGTGYSWLTVGTAVLIGGGAWLFDPGVLVTSALFIGVAAGLTARTPPVAAVAMGVSAGIFLLVAGVGNPPLPVLTGAVALGTVTSGMLLGHWYLVDPRIPRRPLQGLAAAAAGGIVLDAVVVLVPVIPLTESGVPALVSPVLAAVSCVLLIAVWFSLRYPSYSGVMAATGLGYLAILTCLGSITTARLVAEGTLALH